MPHFSSRALATLPESLAVSFLADWFPTVWFRVGEDGSASPSKHTNERIPYVSGFKTPPSHPCHPRSSFNRSRQLPKAVCMHNILLQLVAMNRMLAPQPSLLLLHVKNITTASKFKTSAQKPPYYPWKPLVCHRAVSLRLNIVRARFRSNGQLPYRFTLSMQEAGSGNHLLGTGRQSRHWSILIGLQIRLLRWSCFCLRPWATVPVVTR